MFSSKSALISFTAVLVSGLVPPSLKAQVDVQDRLQRAERLVAEQKFQDARASRLEAMLQALRLKFWEAGRSMALWPTSQGLQLELVSTTPCYCSTLVTFPT